MAHNAAQLGQNAPAGTSAVSIYSMGAAGSAVITGVSITNIGSAVARASLYHDDDGTTYDDTTILVNKKAIPVGKTRFIPANEFKMGTNDTAGNWAIKTDVGSALQFTLYGIEMPT